MAHGVSEGCCSSDETPPHRPFQAFCPVLSAISGAFGRASKGIGIHHLGRELISEWVILLAPLAEQEIIIGRIKESLEAIDALEEHYRAIKGEQDQLDQSILAKAFRGELVPQDPNDEPAALLLDRIRAEREKLNPKGKKQRSKRQKQP